jgi:hypothetical protein
VVLAQNTVPGPDSTQTIPEKTPSTDHNLKRESTPSADTQSGRSGSLSTQLDRSNGVITPRTGIDPGMKIPAPAAGAAVTPVVPPSATGGENAK